MLEQDKNPHKGCPYRFTCKKDETKCCYLQNNNECYLNTTQSEDYI